MMRPLEVGDRVRVGPRKLLGTIEGFDKIGDVRVRLDVGLWPREKEEDFVGEWSPSEVYPLSVVDRLAELDRG